jgi:hypothetical protein
LVMMWVESGLTSTLPTAWSRSSAFSGIGCVTKIFEIIVKAPESLVVEASSFSMREYEIRCLCVNIRRISDTVDFSSGGE